MARTAVRTYVTGMLMTAAILNLDLRDNEAWHYDKILENAERFIPIPLFADDSPVTTGDDRRTFTFPFACTIVGFHLALVTPSSAVDSATPAGIVEVQMHHVGLDVDMLTTPGTVDAGEMTSYTAVDPAVINNLYEDVAQGDQVRFDVDEAGPNVEGLTVILEVER